MSNVFIWVYNRVNESEVEALVLEFKTVFGTISLLLLLGWLSKYLLGSHQKAK